MSSELIAVQKTDEQCSITSCEGAARSNVSRVITVYEERPSSGRARSLCGPWSSLHISDVVHDDTPAELKRHSTDVVQLQTSQHHNQSCTSHHVTPAQRSPSHTLALRFYGRPME